MVSKTNPGFGAIRKRDRKRQSLSRDQGCPYPTSGHPTIGEDKNNSIGNDEFALSSLWEIEYIGHKNSRLLCSFPNGEF
ncbi:MAG: hypothetical protein ACYDAO_10705 [Thermoplasmataceae archaeon]